jgi:alpha-beta hydrolase superfamily lysophospholipase
MCAAKAAVPTHSISAPLVDAHGRPWGHRDSRVRFAAAHNPKGALVFVHGFWGKAESTWAGFPELLTSGSSAVAKAADYDLYFFAYDSKISAIASATLFGEFIKQLASVPAKEAINPSLGSFGPETRKDRWADSKFEYQRIIICGHSLGALVVRRGLLDLALAPKSTANAWLPKVELILFAPAHLGARIIPLVSMMLGGLGAVFYGIRIDGRVGEAALRYNFPSLDDLERNSTTLQQLVSDTDFFLKAKPSAVRWLQAKVIAAEYEKIVYLGRFASDDVPPVLVRNANHTSICKPLSLTHDALTNLLPLL